MGVVGDVEGGLMVGKGELLLEVSTKDVETTLVRNNLVGGGFPFGKVKN